ncbi:MAG: TIGR04076 family protein [Chloroflexi bacterium]|nr:TIGR04076 family protein [Chloroflexota bacterium]
MAEGYDIVIKVISQEGNCAMGHKLGDEWTIAGGKSPAGLCLTALAAVYPYAKGLSYGASFPWEAAKDAATVACPDAKNPVVFQVKRVRAK